MRSVQFRDHEQRNESKGPRPRALALDSLVYESTRSRASVPFSWLEGLLWGMHHKGSNICFLRPLKAQRMRLVLERGDRWMTDSKSLRNVISAGMKSTNNDEARMLLPENQPSGGYNPRMKLGERR